MGHAAPLLDREASERTRERALPDGRTTRSSLTDELNAAGIRLNPSVPDPWDMVVQDVDQFTRRLTSPLKNGMTELAEMYVEGVWDCEDVSEWIYRCLTAGLNRRFVWCVPNIAQYWDAKLFNLQTKSRAGRDVPSHYDLGPVFEAMLDPTMAYTCAYWKEGVKNLEEAQLAKYDLVCRKLGISPGMSVLDTGCGWGGFLRFAAEHYGANPCLGVTLSEDQVALGNKRSQNLPVRLALQDYRDVEGTFDRIASIGVLEHVGPKNYRTYFETVYKALKPGGLLLAHTFGSVIPSPTLLQPEVEWINNAIFPGLVNPSIGQLLSASDGLFIALDLQEFGYYYYPTLMAWNENFTKNWPKIKDGYDERFYRKWRYYLQGCAGAFRAGKYRLWQVVLGKDWKGVYQAVR
jgi:cyclopropane-fatty-acyl-phospholipid synthase